MTEDVSGIGQDVVGNAVITHPDAACAAVLCLEDMVRAINNVSPIQHDWKFRTDPRGGEFREIRKTAHCRSGDVKFIEAQLCAGAAKEFFDSIVVPESGRHSLMRMYVSETYWRVRPEIKVINDVRLECRGGESGDVISDENWCTVSLYMRYSSYMVQNNAEVLGFDMPQ